MDHQNCYINQGYEYIGDMNYSQSGKFCHSWRESGEQDSELERLDLAAVFPRSITDFGEVNPGLSR